VPILYHRKSPGNLIFSACNAEFAMLDLELMKKPLWNFTDNQGTFVSQSAASINTLYFPLCNERPFMSSVTPHLRGDIKTGFNSFLLEPASRSRLANSKSSRNFWAYINPKKVWSLSGVSKDTAALKNDVFRLEAGLLWQTISRQNKKIGLKSEITSFVPSGNDPVEIMFVKITNISAKKIRFIPTAAIPLYARSAANLHDHRHVTSLLNRIKADKYGIVVTPTLLFDESGHKKNDISYFVLGTEGKSLPPEYIFPTQEEFRGENSDLEAPEAVFKNLLPDKKLNPQGKEPMAGLRFKAKLLKPKQSCTYIIIMGISDEENKIFPIFKKFNSQAKVIAALARTKTYWQQKSCDNAIVTSDPEFNNWFHWVNTQPALRKIFGCSFLPDFDYGKGGRGWRDLWQDCLSLILNNPKEVRPLLINNFRGVRIDGSNATIIGTHPGEFIADRNNIPRVWMDHGIWPLLTTLLYVHQTSDLKILLEETTYFRDCQLCRGREKDLSWSGARGNQLKTRSGKIYRGTILEHLLIENIVQFFNVGPHNHIRLEGADWNDGLDMAQRFGESVAFSALYAQNLNSICEILERLGSRQISLLKEIAILIDPTGAKPLSYSNVKQKVKTLDKYFQAVKSGVSGEKISVPAKKLINDLKKKADWITGHIRKDEWVREGFFNGYYDNNKRRVEGRINGLLRMTLTGQVFPVMSGVATDEQVKILFNSARKYLKDKRFAGFHLNTDFRKEQPALGRAFSFVYGEKENGAFFNHMAVMFAYALYKRGFAAQGHEVLNSIYRMAIDSGESKIYPGLPEYFNAEGKGMYSYLTGSASWFILTLLTQAFGLRGEYGDLMIEPKLARQQFNTKGIACLKTNFAGKVIETTFVNRLRKNYGEYSISQIRLNGKTLAQDLRQPRYTLPRKALLRLANRPINFMEVTLG
jgi:cellobiose phosphorylase